MAKISHHQYLGGCLPLHCSQPQNRGSPAVSRAPGPGPGILDACNGGGAAKQGLYTYHSGTDNTPAVAGSLRNAFLLNPL